MSGHAAARRLPGGPAADGGERDVPDRQAVSNMRNRLDSLTLSLSLSLFFFPANYLVSTNPPTKAVYGGCIYGYPGGKGVLALKWGWGTYLSWVRGLMLLASSGPNALRLIWGPLSARLLVGTLVLAKSWLSSLPNLDQRAGRIRHGGFVCGYTRHYRPRRHIWLYAASLPLGF